MVLVNEGARHCGQTNPVDSKPSGLGQQGGETLRASYKHLTVSPSGLGQQGARHCRQAKSMVAVVQKGVNGTVAQQSKQQSKSNPQWSWPNGMRPWASYQFFLQQAMAVAPQGRQLRGQANLCTSSPSGLGQQEHKTLQASCVWQQAPAVSANKGTRQCGRALLVAVVRKGVDETAARLCQNCPNKRIFFAGKATASASTLMQRLTQLAAFLKQKSNAPEVKFSCFHGAPLKRRAEWADKFCI